MQVQVDPDEDTEWNDILREKGVIPEKPPSPSDQIEEALQEILEQANENRLEHKNLDELEELEGEEDEEFLNIYKQKRFEEIKKLTAKSKFGLVLHLSKPEYKQEVTVGSDDVYVLVHLSSSAKIQSRLLSQLFVQAAEKFKEIKFVEIPGNRAIENYPDANCPTLLIYHKGDVLKQYITLTQLGGNATTLEDLEKVLVDIGSVKDSDERLVINLEDQDVNEAHRLRFVKKTIRDTRRADDDDDEDDFFD